ncbi:MAG: hypothetical protein H6862_04905 [Rhodospirillales bacterium]|nr:hypothetical protein [Rhodospirillales bacterium]
MNQEKKDQIIRLLGDFQTRVQPGDDAVEMDLLRAQITAIKEGDPGPERVTGGAVKSLTTPSGPDISAITKLVCCP